MNIYSLLKKKFKKKNCKNKMKIRNKGNRKTNIIFRDFEDQK
jgi:hypothetical protein